MKRGRDTGSVIARQAKRRKLAQTQMIPRSMVQNEVRRQISKQADYKSTVSLANVTCSWSGVMAQALASLSRGTAALDQFEGSSINIQGVHIRANCLAADATQTLRMIAFQWLDSGVPVPNGILDYTSSIYAVEAPKYWTNRQNIRVLRDVVYTMDTASNPQVEINEYIPGRKFLQVWFPTGSTTPQNGGVYVLFITDSGAVTHPTLKYVIQTVFTD